MYILNQSKRLSHLKQNFQYTIYFSLLLTDDKIFLSAFYQVLEFASFKQNLNSKILMSLYQVKMNKILAASDFSNKISSRLLQ